jgi:hypothetical protein
LDNWKSSAHGTVLSVLSTIMSLAWREISGAQVVKLNRDLTVNTMPITQVKKQKEIHKPETEEIPQKLVTSGKQLYVGRKAKGAEKTGRWAAWPKGRAE